MPRNPSHSFPPLLTTARLGWSLASLVGLVLARVLNIWVIKQRSHSSPPPPPHHRNPYHPADSSSFSQSPGTLSSRASPSPPRLTEYLVSVDSAAAAAAFGSTTKIRLRGTPDDLAAVTSQAWLRAKTRVEGYLEAAAKLAVYLVACLSGNMTQAGAIVFMALLIVSAALLALSNAHAKGYRMNGRVAAVLPDGDEGRDRQAGVRGAAVGREPPYPVRKRGDGADEERRTGSWPGDSDASGFTRLDDTS